MAQLVLVVVAVFAGLVGYYEAAKVEARFGEGPWGLSATVCGVFAFSLGIVVAFIATPLAMGVVFGLVGYNQAANYEQQQRRQLLGLPSLPWGGVCAAFALVGTLITSTLAWGIVCLVLGLTAGLFLVIAERDELIADRDASIREKDAWVAEKKSLLAQAQTKSPMAARTNSQGYSDAVATALRAQEAPRPPASEAPPLPLRRSLMSLKSASPSTPRRDAPSTGNVGGHDLLPRSAQRVAQSTGGIDGNDLLPRRP